MMVRIAKRLVRKFHEKEDKINVILDTIANQDNTDDQFYDKIQIAAKDGHWK